ncbi:carbonic anhydrase 4-like protein [Lates japonicus]|uniref:Carbonic anhydrase 4 n=1 Tax=Lates japonicus TaxID=270547 RepID=A0AAD3M3S3_LATJO|nr:carbonic anhydrase 4-like protein [Lates japonicus]
MQPLITRSPGISLDCLHKSWRSRSANDGRPALVAAEARQAVQRQFVVGVPHLSTISGGGLPSTYKAVQFHLHWGKNGGPGSEHTIDGEQYPMEIYTSLLSVSLATADPIWAESAPTATRALYRVH